MRPVQFVRVPDVGVPNNGVVKVGDVANTRFPVPVSPTTHDARFALVGVARKVATFVPSPETPVEIGRPIDPAKFPAMFNADRVCVFGL